VPRPRVVVQIKKEKKKRENEKNETDEKGKRKRNRRSKPMLNTQYNPVHRFIYKVNPRPKKTWRIPKTASISGRGGH
jgi:hypothetical protein